jgi:hypothetical protein
MQSTMLRTTFQVIAWMSISCHRDHNGRSDKLASGYSSSGERRKIFGPAYRRDPIHPRLSEQNFPVGLGLVLAVFMIEFAQIASLGRHARLRDAGIKTLGVLAGVALGYGLQAGLAWTAWRRSAQRDNKA